uniref:Uncharacterized protein n=1 Tax=Chromera velia CCMP2878 TaxID=1169474 RepID=A0A0G4GCN9_9ALVE|mmetsp:Transcript_51729/g.101390  ORF Transcript_51729/g.101390 Transcript_51729/m.101390 type:complete len:189 (-) Transcript_51729:189-755(-)|eukprot:Cvel_21332.t1-p1 / transcript=Cvel_21332.t1 / gene=Cvel_21332 / organism=Chromera_velia_CCMP2878 / gene_product=hypothetical protein / transcript_product=hypothetical protein / location=Cvel_scaffold1989:21052-23181(-) / protein_length=188 / sequence_SO=supercontig / SO=protein_coding / is_pseudo=false
MPAGGFLLAPDPYARWNEGEREVRGHHTDMIQEGRRKYGRDLDITAYATGHDPCFLGICGKNYTGKPYGNDSSAAQTVLAGPAFWKRTAFKPDLEETLSLTQKKGSSSGGAPTFPTLSVPPATINIKEFVDTFDKSYRPDLQPGERINFFNTLPHKYTAAGETKWNVDTKGHRSSKHEVAFMANVIRR